MILGLDILRMGSLCGFGDRFTTLLRRFFGLRVLGSVDLFRSLALALRFGGLGGFSGIGIQGLQWL